MKLCPNCKTGSLVTTSNCVECGENLGGQSETNPENLAGLILDQKYRFESFLGSGANGFVYRAKHISLDRDVAVKLLSGDRAPGEDQVKQFKQEALSASRLIHPHIVAVLDFGQTSGGLIYMVIEYIPGDTLWTLETKMGALPVARAYGIMHQVMSAVEEAHTHGVIHRDLKPENVIVTPLRSGEDFAKVLDFGIAILMNDSALGKAEEKTFAGTPGYIAPEHISGEDPTTLCDVYALGALFWGALAGKPAFDGNSVLEVINRQLLEDPPSLAGTLGEHHPAITLDPILKKAMARDPALRYQSAAEFRDAVADAFAAVNAARLSCSTCVRPRDPATHLCSLHQPNQADTPKKPAKTTDRLPEAYPQTVSEKHPRIDFDRDELSGMIDRSLAPPQEPATETILDFLAANDRLLELTGPPTSNKKTLMKTTALALETIGFKVLTAYPDPTVSSTPWYSLRTILASSLTQAPHLLDPAAAINAARALDVGPDTLLAVGAIFGQNARSGEHEAPLDAMVIYRGFVDVLQRACEKNTWTGLQIWDADAMDRASKRLLIRWLISDDWTPTKVFISSVAGYLPSTQSCTTLRLTAFPEDTEVFLSSVVAQLTAEEKEVLQVIAALGSTVPIDLLEALLDPTQLYLSLDYLSKKQLITADPDKQVSLTSAQVERAANTSIDADANRKSLHQRIFHHLEQGNHTVFQLARHARYAGEMEKGVNLLERAGDQARRFGDHDGAAFTFYKPAVHAARWELLLGDDNPRYLALSKKLGDALLQSGHKLSAEVVFKELLSNASKDPSMVEHTRGALALCQPQPASGPDLSSGQQPA